MEKKRDSNNKIKRTTINQKSKIIYCNRNNPDIEYVKYNKKYMNLSDFKRIIHKKTFKAGTPVFREQDIVTLYDMDAKGYITAYDDDAPENNYYNSRGVFVGKKYKLTKQIYPKASEWQMRRHIHNGQYLFTNQKNGLFFANRISFDDSNLPDQDIFNITNIIYYYMYFDINENNIIHNNFSSAAMHKIQIRPTMNFHDLYNRELGSSRKYPTSHN